MYNTTLETLPLDKLRALQNERLAGLVDRVYHKVPFYKNMLDAAGLRPADIQNVEDLPYGEEGVLVFTTLTKQAFPLLRYWTNDICSIDYDPDAKRTHIKMSTLKGRADDMLIIRGVNLFHTQVEALLDDMPHLAPNYQLIVSRKGAMDHVKLDIELAETFSHHLTDPWASEQVVQWTRALGKKIKENIGLSMEVELQAYDTIPRSAGGKLSRIKDLRNSA